MRRARILTACSCLGLAAAVSSAGFGEPVRLEAGGKPIDVEIGHSARFWADVDGDGKNERLVGQFGGGKLRIYKNRGTAEAPHFQDFTWFEAGGTTGKVPSG